MFSCVCFDIMKSFGAYIVTDADDESPHNGFWRFSRRDFLLCGYNQTLDMLEGMLGQEEEEEGLLGGDLHLDNSHQSLNLDDLDDSS